MEKQRVYSSFILCIQSAVFSLFFAKIFIKSYTFPGLKKIDYMIDNLKGRYTGMEALSANPFKDFYVFFIIIILAISVGLIFLSSCNIIINKPVTNLCIVTSFIQITAGFFLFFKFSWVGYILEGLCISSLVLSLIHDKKTTNKETTEILLRNLAIIASLAVLLLFALVISVKVTGTY